MQESVALIANPQACNGNVPCEDQGEGRHLPVGRRPAELVPGAGARAAAGQVGDGVRRRQHRGRRYAEFVSPPDRLPALDEQDPQVLTLQSPAAPSERRAAPASRYTEKGGEKTCLVLSLLRVDSEHAGGDVHGEDQEADDHRFYSRYGFSFSFSSLLCPSSPGPVLCLGMLREQRRRVTVPRLKWTVVTL